MTTDCMTDPFNIIADGLSILQASAMPGTRSGKDRIAKHYLNRRFSRDSWPIAVQPINFIPRSISARIRPSARSTPA